MNVCTSCGREIVAQDDPRLDWENFCDGIITQDTNPYAVEMEDDHTLYWECDTLRYQSAQEI